MRFPSLQAVQALDAVHRLGTMLQAGEELSLSRSAISHQLRALEIELGYPLTFKVGRGVQLTPRAIQFLVEARKALAILANAASAPKDHLSVSGRLRISCAPGFATAWLCPRIGEFQSLQPDIRIEITTPRAFDDATATDVDCFIVFGDGDWPGMKSDLLAEVAFTPVCSPALLNSRGGLERASDLRRFPLLHLASSSNWSRWLSAAECFDIDASVGLFFSDMHLVHAAVIAGQGVALGDSLISQEWLNGGALVRPFSLTIKANGAYYCVIQARKVGRPAVQVFHAWLKDALTSGRSGQRFSSMG